ncbi:hypothetical protein NLI96_g1816 [Meripilus lineatus]|uniref:AB hydrolase-1 domain-containing protein n=1 Tax=Meripilus lineatus TaxID=2056292 RepID=A0AAD5V9Q2_9APHY|nr:hypothetical protein NLI96_g1816 [Physisporinus lineatus]
MNPLLYKDLLTSRGLTYHYYASPATDSKLTLLFCHGFPSTSRDWRHLVSFFQSRGYGIIVPDMLGYGGTDKPTEPKMYRHNLVCKDIIEILDAEKVEKSVAIGHDFGSYVVSRLSNHYPERFIAYAFFSVPFVRLVSAGVLKEMLADSKRRYGYDTIGYWTFLAEDGSEGIIESNWESFYSLIYPHDPELWKTHIAPQGAMKESLLAGFKAPLPKYLIEEDKEIASKALLGGGLSAPTCWFKAMLSGIEDEDNEGIPETKIYPPTSCPIFFGAGNQDRVSISDAGIKSFAHTCFENHDITVGEYHADHWLILSVPNEINRELETWLESVVAPA